MRCPCVPWSLARRTLAAALVVIGALGAGVTAHAARAPEPVPDDLQVTIHGSGQVVSIDPVTGRIRTPSPHEAAALSRSFQRSTTPLPARTVVHVDGGVEVLELPEEYDEVMVARFGPFGATTFDCLSGHEAALEHLAEPVFDPLALPLYELTAALSWRNAVPLVPSPVRSVPAPVATPAVYEEE